MTKARADRNPSTSAQVRSHTRASSTSSLIIPTSIQLLSFNAAPDARLAPAIQAAEHTKYTNPKQIGIILDRHTGNELIFGTGTE